MARSKPLRPGVVAAATGLLVLAGLAAWWFLRADAPMDAGDVDDLMEEWDGAPLPPPAAPPTVTAPRRAPSSLPDAMVPQPDPDAAPEPLAARRTQTRLFGTAQVKPIYDRYDVQGVRVTRIAPDSFWATVGVVEGDVVVEVNGELIDDPEAMVSLMNQMTSAPVLLLRVRGADGAERLIDYRVPRPGSPTR